MEDKRSDDLYSIPSFPTLTVNDLEISADWYEKAVGFKLVASIPDANGKKLLSHVRWAKYADLFLVASSPENPLPESKGVGVLLTFAVTDRSVDDLACSFKENNVDIVFGPVDQPWNARELTVIDPDGYLLKFTEVIDSSLTFESVLKNINDKSK